MIDSKSLDVLVPYDRPGSDTGRTILLALRRMAIGGIADAQSAHFMFRGLGLGFRRPLMFMRAFVLEVGRVSRQPIAIAPCCCPRMTDGEAALLLLIESGRDHPDMARDAFARVSGTLDTLVALSIAQALADALDDIGRPLSL